MGFCEILPVVAFTVTLLAQQRDSRRGKNGASRDTNPDLKGQDAVCRQDAIHEIAMDAVATLS